MNFMLSLWAKWMLHLLIVKCWIGIIFSFIIFNHFLTPNLMGSLSKSYGGRGCWRWTVLLMIIQIFVTNTAVVIIIKIIWEEFVSGKWNLYNMRFFLIITSLLIKTYLYWINSFMAALRRKLRAWRRKLRKNKRVKNLIFYFYHFRALFYQNWKKSASKDTILGLYLRPNIPNIGKIFPYNFSSLGP